MLNRKPSSHYLKKNRIRKKYELLILLVDEFNANRLKFWVFTYAKGLKRFSAGRISVISRGRHKLAYLIDYKSKGIYIQFNFWSSPKYIVKLLSLLRKDPNILRFLILNKKIK